MFKKIRWQGANQESLSGFDEAEPFFPFGTDMGYQNVVETQVLEGREKWIVKVMIK